MGGAGGGTAPSPGSSLRSRAGDRQAILRELDAHSQLEAVARVHELSLALEKPEPTA
jgi:hypothetical protein